MLRISHLTKTYGSKTAVSDLTLHIAPGEIYGFIGHNGAGKTTTLKACCGILPFDQGEILVDGISVKEDPLACKKRIAYIPDNPDLYEFLTGFQYLNFIADVFAIPKDERKRRGLIEATDAVKDRFGEAALRFGRELRGEGNTTGSASKNPADYK